MIKDEKLWKAFILILDKSNNKCEEESIGILECIDCQGSMTENSGILNDFQL